MDEFIKYILIIYLVIINITSFVIMGIDKKRARNKEWRISEATLFATALLFGSLGSNIGMKYFRHKTKHWYFVVFMPLILIVQVLILAFVINRF